MALNWWDPTQELAHPTRTGTAWSQLAKLYCWKDNVLLPSVILAPEEGGVETSWKSAGGTYAGKAIGNAGAQMLVKLLE
ncbi:hypothetical protein TNCV_593081 [Trichonephila clavipes]|nr:hypothetical protein TNCV_593081 [Trichonephila clavipes]